MGLLQKAVETYDAHSDFVGEEIQEHQVLLPVSHILARADLEITLEPEGAFSSARAVDKSEPKIPIPATEESAGRTSGACAHPLCDQLCYLAPCNGEKHRLYVDQLAAWASSPYSHPMIRPILTYVRGGTILSDLGGTGLIELDEKGVPKNEKLMVRWRVHGVGTPRDGCWQQPSLFRAFQDWYASLQPEGSSALCMITGRHAAAAKQHQKGIIPINGNAKLISSNDTSNFTFRGRFTDDSQAATVSYEASQKAHNALRWIAAEQGARVIFGGRTFLCWNPQGIQICHATAGFGNRNQVKTVPSDYRRELENTLDGMRSQLPEQSGVVIAAFDAATTGRLSVTYYNELLGSDYLQRLYDWDAHCCWFFGWDKFRAKSAIQSPLLRRIVDCAFGTLSKEKGQVRLKTDDKTLGQQMQRLVACRVDRGRMPLDIMKALFHRASTPQSFDDPAVREEILATACAVIRKYRYDVYKEECAMEFDPNKNDISFQFGRLLAVLEKVERDTYDSDETREPNAIRLQSIYCQRPLHTAGMIEKQLERAYFPRLPKPAFRAYYKNLIGEILDEIYAFDEKLWNAPLKETYLMGYYLQRKELYTKKEKSEENKEEN